MKNCNILILRPFFTAFHKDLSNYIDCKTYAFIFKLGDTINLKGCEFIFVNKNIKKINPSSYDLNLVKKTKTFYSETYKPVTIKNIEHQAKYISYLRKFIKDKKITLVTMHNDLAWQHALAIQVCKELRVKYLITERGIFRPDTTTIEFLGVNGYSSLSKDKEFYKNYDVKKKDLKSYKVSKWTNLKVNIKFALFILLNKIGDLLGINSKIKNKKYSLLKYIELFIKQKILKKNSSNVQLPKKYMFVPLQVNTDTQILIHSDFNNIQEFISKIEKDFYSLNTDISLIFKIHPMEKGIVDYKFDSRSVVVDSDTNELVKHCEGVITINSTVGFEALREHKKVLVLGEAFYKIDGIVICSSQEQFKQDLKDTLENKNSVDIFAIDKFVDYLQYEYQVNGNLFNWNEKTLEEVKNKIYTNKS